jgi:hypothetical protein
MRRAFLFALAGALLVAAVTAALWYNARPDELAERPPGHRPELLLLTSLPIVFPDKFSLEGGASPALEALRRRYRVVPISVADRASLAGHRLLLMAQPQAQTAEILVELDQWVRGGGRVLLLADPALQWPSERPLGDPLRPPFAFSDTGLLGHWGLRLDAPISLGVKTVETGGRTIRTAAPGELTATAANCAVGEVRLIAHCRIGKGRATVIADADFLDVEVVRGADTAKLGLLLSQLASLEK